MLAGCATATIEDAVPEGALESAATAGGPPEAAVSSGAPSETGEFPNLNEVQRGAMAQMTPEEKKAYLAQLRAARARQAASAADGGPRQATEAELERIARTHDDEALREIEGEAAD